MSDVLREALKSHQKGGGPLGELFGIERLSELKKFCARAEITKENFSHTILGCQSGWLPWRHQISHRDFVPEHLQPSEEELKETGPLEVGQPIPKHLRKIMRIFDERRLLVGHIFYNAGSVVVALVVLRSAGHVRPAKPLGSGVAHSPPQLAVATEPECECRLAAVPERQAACHRFASYSVQAPLKGPATFVILPSYEAMRARIHRWEHIVLASVLSACRPLPCCARPRTVEAPTFRSGACCWSALAGVCPSPPAAKPSPWAAARLSDSRRIGLPCGNALCRTTLHPNNEGPVERAQTSPVAYEAAAGRATVVRLLRRSH